MTVSIHTIHVKWCA